MEDIEHDLPGLVGDRYGEVVQIMTRPRGGYSYPCVNLLPALYCRPNPSVRQGLIGSGKDGGVDDKQLRSALKKQVLAAHANDPNTRIVEELGLDHGASRVDVAVVNGMIHGFEIKSERDTLSRLHRQMQIYNAVLDRVTLVTCPRHTDAALRAIPEWWGVKLAEMGPRGGVRFHTLQRARNNPSLQPLVIARLLWREEAITLLEQIGQSRGLIGKPRAMLYARLAEVAPLDLLRCWVRERLKTRTAFRFRLR
jgi:hypothetical protein